jgi:hypothetical protein
MEIWRYRHKNKSDINHATSPLSDYTLCGLASDTSFKRDGCEHQEDLTIGNINCQECVRVIEHISQYKNHISDYLINPSG